MIGQDVVLVSENSLSLGWEEEEIDEMDSAISSSSLHPQSGSVVDEQLETKDGHEIHAGGITDPLCYQTDENGNDICGPVLFFHNFESKNICCHFNDALALRCNVAVFALPPTLKKLMTTPPGTFFLHLTEARCVSEIFICGVNSRWNRM